MDHSCYAMMVTQLGGPEVMVYSEMEMPVFNRIHNKEGVVFFNEEPRLKVVEAEATEKEFEF